jgi:hypothetical protein
MANPLGFAKKAYPIALMMLPAFIGSRRFIASIFNDQIRRRSLPGLGGDSLFRSHLRTPIQAHKPVLSNSSNPESVDWMKSSQPHCLRRNARNAVAPGVLIL